MSDWWWVAFAGVVGLLLGLDLFVFHRHSTRDGTRRALAWSAFWIGLGLAFSLVVGVARGHDAALTYLTAYLIEQSLSVDNLFVFVALFSYFSVAPEHHHRVLFWGILGVIVTRGAFIFAGVALIARFEWVVYVLGAILIATAAKLGLSGDEEVHPEKNLVVRFASRVLPMVKRFHGDKFVVRTERGWRFTPLLLVLLAIESTDVMFAVDSVPAVLAISRDSFVVYTSNVFAILGLRALYFALAGALRSLRFLRPALAVILGLVGVKMLLAEVVAVPTELSLGVIALILATATAASLLLPERGGASRRA
ncbi:MAG: TerC/Alx family metal homeostasis membrane protein [Thermoanaerobaculaceae bacterium]|nr:TerC/Alx family metal homeostasis membrane protein [Thermoanaerobaculaceae bacterium]TAM48787.1 MAG: TerC/Alx family metal homeostasis membrane protein [Acidobacteriota bacterium]